MAQVRGGLAWRGWWFGVAVLSPLMLCGCPTAINDPNSSSDSNSTASDTTNNNSFATATQVALTNNAANFTGAVGGSDPVDLFSIGPVAPGDRVQIDVQTTSGDLDGVAALFDGNQDVQAFNDDRAEDGSNVNPLIDLVIRGPAGNYTLGVAPYPGSNSSGNYKVAVSITRAAGGTTPTPQVIFLNWSGGQNVTIRNVGTYNLPPFSGADVGQTFAGQTQALKDGVLKFVKNRYAGWNVTFLSSDTSPVPTGPHSTVFFGGVNQAAFAISEQIDLLDQDPNDNCIVYSSSYIDAFSVTPTLDQMVAAMGNTVAHECGHLMGLVHTRECDDLMNSSCGNDSILVTQAFTRATLDSSVFPVGFQNSPELLNEAVGVTP